VRRCSCEGGGDMWGGGGVGGRKGVRGGGALWVGCGWVALARPRVGKG